MRAGRRSTLNVEDILKKLLSGKLTVEQAKRELDAFKIKKIGDLARLDIHRGKRIGVPEAIFAEGKTPEFVAKAAIEIAKKNCFSLVTRVSNAHLKSIRSKLPKDFNLEHNREARTVVIRRGDHVFPKLGRIGVLAAGTADVPVAEEAAVVARVMGCEVVKAYDVGIAGIHRLFEPLRLMVEKGVSTIVVVAGMEGTLPSVVASLVDVPVIGVPTSTGYGAGGRGLAALLTMLQSCSPGLTVVNINNGFGGGMAAALIAKQAGKRS